MVERLLDQGNDSGRAGDRPFRRIRATEICIKKAIGLCPIAFNFNN